MKSSFSVGYRLNRKTYVIMGVSSIVPNLNGILFFTEDGENVQIEQETLGNMFITYEDFAELNSTKEYTIIDHRKAN